MPAHDGIRAVGAHQLLVAIAGGASFDKLGRDLLDRLAKANVGIAALHQVALDAVTAGGPRERARQLEGVARVIVTDVNLGPRPAAIEVLAGQHLGGQLTGANFLTQALGLFQNQHTLARTGQRPCARKPTWARTHDDHVIRLVLHRRQCTRVKKRAQRRKRSRRTGR